jgi:hypothetical protein
MSTTSFISNDPTYDLATTATATTTTETETETSKPREPDELYASASGRDIIVSRDDKDKE